MFLRLDRGAIGCTGFPRGPGVVHRPDGQGTHVANGPVHLVLEQSLGRLEAHADPLVHRSVHSLGRAESFLDHTLKSSNRLVRAELSR